MNNAYLELKIEDEIFYLLHQRAVFRPATSELIISDVHLGKASHFRKKGIAMPAQSHLKDVDRLHYLIDTWKPKSVLFLGDLFHSDYNREWLWLKSILLHYPEIIFKLVVGNHDVLPESEYSIPNLKKFDTIEEDNFIFSHAPLERPAKLNFCGHIHPGLRLTGKARQSIKLPCFYLDKTHFILPAFGELTGLFLLEQKRSAQYFLVTAETIVKL
jgi:DNA ligase-associated metallophosphoesterase